MSRKTTNSESIIGETRVAKISNGRLKATELNVHGRTKDIRNASPVPFSSLSQSRGEKLPIRIKSNRVLGPVMVPVISSKKKPLMPCHPARARELVKKGQAVKRWYRGIFCLKLLNRIDGNVQQIAVGIDPGSQHEALTVKSKDHTYLNVLSDSITWVSRRMKERKEARRRRRFRKTPCRIMKRNHNVNSQWLAPSTRARWEIKLNILKFLYKLFPITDICIEDTRAISKKYQKKWNYHFSHVETGKNWFYDKCRELTKNVYTLNGNTTFKLRNSLELKKYKLKSSSNFEAHNIDSWTLANFITGGHIKPDNKNILRIIPLQLHRRQLHFFNFNKGHIRKLYGGTSSFGFKRGSIVIHNKYGLTYIGGSSYVGKTRKKKISLHNIKTGERVSQQANPEDIKFLCYNPWRTFVYAS